MSGRSVAYLLALQGVLSPLFYRPGGEPPTIDCALPHQSLINKMPYMAYLQPKLMEAFFSPMEVPFFGCIQACSSCPKLSSTHPQPHCFPSYTFSRLVRFLTQADCHLLGQSSSNYPKGKMQSWQ